MPIAQHELDAQGVLSYARFIESPNCDARPSDTPIELLVIHNISLPPGEFGGSAVIALFTNNLDCSQHPFYQNLRNLHVSAHFFIRRSGEIIQFVSCNKRAWHAGNSEWKGRQQCNDFSIGIEIEGTDSMPYEPCQYEKLAAVSKSLLIKYPIVDIVGHSDIAPGRKTDPGPSFDWHHYRKLLDEMTASEPNRYS